MPFLSLPPEVRDEIYSHFFRPSAIRRDDGAGGFIYNYREALVLFRVNRQVHHESRRIFRKLNTFILIETPWKDAKQHVAQDGHVYLITAGARADDFTDHTLQVSIRAPQHHLYPDLDRFVIHLDDLDKFCTSWFYSNISMPFLNNHLSLELILRDPYTPDHEEKRVPKAVQQHLLMPFGRVKGLQSLAVKGDPKPYTSVEKDMRAEMDTPLDSPEKCLRDATRLKDEGNVELQAGRYKEALELYRQAWLAMHIIVNGKSRHVHGDHYFDKELTEEPFSGKNGSTERTTLRIRLVANTILAYLKLEDYDMAIHTGLRTIKIIRFSIGVPEEEGAGDPSQEAFTSFFAAAEMGKIYYRTALAYKALDDKYEARKLLKVAVLYLPNDPNIHREIQACALRIL
ncbi:hypothetical protein BDV97DRAFT_361722 [Delphinella strobiligena]|nr:hypothetical protein BDV97DRAFT_361722 [Delphinella strobiligena]